MLDIVLEFVDLFLNFIIDDAVDKTTNNNSKKNLRYIMFSALCAIILIVFAVMVVHTLKTGYLAFAFLFIALAIVVLAFWCRLSYLKNIKKK